MLSDRNDVREYLLEIVLRLEEYIRRESYRGYDPYDVLSSPVFRLPVLSSSRLLRFGAQQVFRRVPFNLRPLLGIQKGYNPVTLGCCIQAYSYLMKIKPEKAREYQQRADYLISELERLQSSGYSGTCWGYDFDWQGRYANIPAHTPTIVATGFITNGLFEFYRLTGSATALSLCISATRFVLNDLYRSCIGDTFCFSYSPTDRQMVLNASMKGARLLAQVYSVTRDPVMLHAARQAVAFVVARQRANGSWPYAHGDARTWSDNHHTAYVLDCLQEYISRSGETEYFDNLTRGFAFYRDRLFDQGSRPKYYDNVLYPIDSTSAAQSIITLSRFGELEKAIRVSLMVSGLLFDRMEGSFFYQKMRWYTHKTSYMRWSNAWMLCAITYLLNALE